MENETKQTKEVSSEPPRAFQSKAARQKRASGSSEELARTMKKTSGTMMQRKVARAQQSRDSAVQNTRS